MANQRRSRKRKNTFEFAFEFVICFHYFPNLFIEHACTQSTKGQYANEFFIINDEKMVFIFLTSSEFVNCLIFFFDELPELKKKIECLFDSFEVAICLQQVQIVAWSVGVA